MWCLSAAQRPPSALLHAPSRSHPPCTLPSHFHTVEREGRGQRRGRDRKGERGKAWGGGIGERVWVAGAAYRKGAPRRGRSCEGSTKHLSGQGTSVVRWFRVSDHHTHSGAQLHSSGYDDRRQRASVVHSLTTRCSTLTPTTRSGRSLASHSSSEATVGLGLGLGWMGQKITGGHPWRRSAPTSRCRNHCIGHGISTRRGRQEAKMEHRKVRAHRFEW